MMQDDLPVGLDIDAIMAETTPTTEATPGSAGGGALARVKTLLESRVEQFAMVATRFLPAERAVPMAIQACSKNRTLLTCDPNSLINSVRTAVRLGLDCSGTLGSAYLVPFKNKDSGRLECQLMIGYQGLIDLATRSGSVRRVWSYCVYEGDRFEVSLGSDPKIIHQPADWAGRERRRITHAYACAEFSNGSVTFEVMSVAELEAVRAKSQMKDGPAWKYGTAEMYRKTTIRRASKYWPKNADLAEVLSVHDPEVDPEPAPASVTVHPIDQLEPEAE
jgi:recombination protein RecT